MKTRDFILYSLIFLACVFGTVQIVADQLTGKQAIALGSKVMQISKDSVKCTDKATAPRPLTSDPQLRVIPEYEAACDSHLVDQMMIFTNMPVSKDIAIKEADQMTQRLQAFEAQNVRPIVIVEPDSEWGLLDFHEFASGYYDPWIKVYFERLKANGITGKQLGIWIPFPEPQQPYWNNNGNPDDFAYSVNRYLGALRATFPDGLTGVLLDVEVDDSKDASQLLAYTRLVDNSLVSVAGVQGFPWYPGKEGDTRKPITSASKFLPAYIVEEVAKSLGTKNILFNTGTFRHKKGDNGGNMAVSTAQREESLDSIAYEAQLLKSAGYNVSVNIFAQNKLQMKEGIDWSYWPVGRPSESHAALFTHFVRRLTDDGIAISLFDAKP